ncbi:hypothetical protein PPSIR1_00465 [Plesiocystis pacifica SIR-1]|uniref:Transcription factor zinc-finger domain-containing protein n=1 Tax=Plesiocystis pacifica SIR-1 TaxID=391625 RepID=A6G7F1_9BACT|nr:zf-TFIIB domain-containing protein [Plesiocystis pacifica]EDM78160.1 hypothetical protein PPSIR1_00465 [Plesiocystis pacifica SIR-1]
MPALVACSSCHRQYDASGYPVGGRFRCHCGEVVEIEALAALEAAVIRCPSCGAPRGEGHSCGRCGAQFEQFERDMASMCPACMTRVSDHARFCHHCGHGLTSEAQVGALSELPCPSCGGEQRMHERLFDSDRVMFECSRCAGLWLEIGTFTQTIAETEANARAGGGPVAWRPGTLEIRTEGLRRACPVCATEMPRRHFGKHSGVIVDYCVDHGVWLDVGELSHILEWIREGGLTQARKFNPNEDVTALPRPKRVVELPSGIETPKPTVLESMLDTLAKLLYPDHL